MLTASLSELAPPHRKELLSTTAPTAVSSPALGGVLSAPDAALSETETGSLSRPLFAAFLAAAVCLLAWRWAGHSRFLIDWDAVNYALGLYKYDVTHDQPHIPGYFLYIYLGRLFLPLAGEANRALVWVSAVFGALCVWMMYLLGRDMFDRRVGALSALLGITSPIFWFQSNVASSRTAEGFFGLLVAWLCARVKWRGDDAALWGLAVALAVAAGIRQQMAPFLLPLCIWATWHLPLKRRLMALGLFLGLCLIWAIPMLQGVGGVSEYRRLSRAQWDLFVVGQTGVFYAHSLTDAARRFAENNSRIILYAGYTLPLGLLLLPFAIREAARRGLLLRGQRVHFLLSATLPSLLFFSILHIQQTGHAMSYAPFFILSVAYGWARLPRRLQAVGAVSLVAANLAFVYFAPPYLGRNGRFMTPSNATVRRTDGFISAVTSVVNTRLRRDDSLIVPTDGIFRTLDFYAADYPVYSPVLNVGPQPPFQVVTHKVEKVPIENGVLDLPSNIRTLLITGTSAFPRLDAATRTIMVTPPRGVEPWAITYPETVRAEGWEQGGLPFTLLHSSRPLRWQLHGRTLEIEAVP